VFLVLFNWLEITAYVYATIQIKNKKMTDNRKVDGDIFYRRVRINAQYNKCAVYESLHSL